VARQHAPADFFVVIGGGESRRHGGGGAILKGADQRGALDLVAAMQRRVRGVGRRPGFVGQQVALDPGPYLLERAEGDAARMFMIGDVVDDAGLERLQEQPRGAADAWGTFALLAHHMAQLLQDQRDAEYGATPAASSPRNRLRSSSIRIARARGLNSRRYCRNRSTEAPSARHGFQLSASGPRGLTSHQGVNKRLTMFVGR
jgi:hypothetical protein